MAYYRQIYTTFWTDPKVADDFTPEDRYFYLYLLTNAHTNLCGCYEVSKRQISNDTGYTVDIVNRLLARMEEVHGIIRYSEQTREVYLVNWHRYNWSRSEKVLKGVANEIEKVKHTEFQQSLIGTLASYGYPIDTLSIPYQYPIDTSVTDTVTVTVSNISTSNDELDDAFDAFWKHYPKKVDKQKAKIAFKKVISKKKITVDELIAAVERHKRSRQWQDASYIPNPTTWLNGSRWEDILPEATASKSKGNDRKNILDSLRQKYAEEEILDEQSGSITDY